MSYLNGSFRHGTGEASLAGLRDDGSERFGCVNRFREIHYESQRGAGAFAARVGHWALNRILSDNKGNSDRHGPTVGPPTVASKTIAARPSNWRKQNAL